MSLLIILMRPLSDPNFLKVVSNLDAAPYVDIIPYSVHYSLDRNLIMWLRVSEHARVYQSELSSDIPHGYHSREEDTRQPGPNVQEVRGGVSAHIQNSHAKQACNDAHSVNSRS